ncbi:unnamed protein product [Lactuca virosa]|uniref:Uncharacterized protein n=1 Tax=Lactuca virosa TaxID=75947 RepID=A0AAU9PL92_9ASTR|nr:unnamed protein product [Lactuca virosa]
MKTVLDSISKVDKGPENEFFPWKIGVLKRTKKPAHITRHLLESPIVEEVPEKSVSPPKENFVSKFKKIRKPQLNRKGVLIREVPAPISPASKKRKAKEMEKNIKEKAKQLEDSLDEVVQETDFEDDSYQSPIHNERI